MIIGCWTKIVYYKSVKVTIDIPELAKVIINMVVYHYGIFESIVTDWGLLFILKFWSLLCYFLGIKKSLSTTFHPQIDGQTKKQNSTMEAYLRVFVNWKQNNWARLLLIAEFTYNNAKNASTDHTLFKLKCGYYPKVSFEDETNLYSRSCSANKLVEKLRKLIEICYQNLFHV